MADATCPLWRGKCREHKCLWYIQVQGTQPNTGQQVSEWGCAVAWLPWLMVDNTKEARQMTASIDRFNNDVVCERAILDTRMQIANQDQPLRLADDSAGVEVGRGGVDIDQPREN